MSGKLLVVGPLPPPLDGCSYANAVLIYKAKERERVVDAIDTSTNVLSAQQGHFSLKKVLGFARSYVWSIKVITANVVYLTPGQTFFGLLKYAPFILLARVLRKPYVIHVHGNHLGRQFQILRGFKRAVFRYLVCGAAGGIVLSNSLRKNFDGLLPSDRVFVAENFAGDDLYLDDRPSKETSQLKVLYLSNLMREKGVVELLDALIALKGIGVSFEAVIAGRMDEEVQKDVHERLQKLSGYANYIGPTYGQQKVDILHRANVLVLPTYYPMEGQPISILEGLAAGNIIVTTDHAGIADVVSDLNGYLVPPRNALAIADCLSAIAASLPTQVAKFSEYNSRYAAGKFTEDAFARRVLSVIEKAAGIGRECEDDFA
jgi:glycosyltransferase involved in cell wall biosynthesis